MNFKSTVLFSILPLAFAGMINADQNTKFSRQNPEPIAIQAPQEPKMTKDLATYYDVDGVRKNRDDRKMVGGPGSIWHHDEHNFTSTRGDTVKVITTPEGLYRVFITLFDGSTFMFNFAGATEKTPRHDAKFQKNFQVAAADKDMTPEKRNAAMMDEVAQVSKINR